MLSTCPVQSGHDCLLTSSMEDLKLRPSSSKSLFSNLKLNCHCHGSSAIEILDSSMEVIIDLPPEYQDHSSVGEECVRSLCEAHLHVADPLSGNVLERHGRNDRIRRYLDSLNDRSDAERWSADDAEPAEKDECISQLRSDDCRLNAGNRPSGTERRKLEDETVALTEDMLLELELEQYEQMKQRLVDEHRENLQRLLVQQEREMAELWTRLSSSGSMQLNCGSLPNGPLGHVQQHITHDISGRGHSQGPPRVHGGFESLAVGEGQNGVFLSIDDTDIRREHCLTTPPVDCYQSFDSLKAKSPAGVYYRDEPNSSPVPSCSTAVTEDEESEFAFRSPAVLTSHRRRRLYCTSTELELPSTGQSLLMQSDTSQQLTPDATSRKSTPARVTFASPSTAAPDVHSNHDHHSRRYVDPLVEV